MFPLLLLLTLQHVHMRAIRAQQSVAVDAVIPGSYTAFDLASNPDQNGQSPCPKQLTCLAVSHQPTNSLAINLETQFRIDSHPCRAATSASAVLSFFPIPTVQPDASTQTTHRYRQWFAQIQPDTISCAADNAFLPATALVIQDFALILNSILNATNDQQRVMLRPPAQHYFFIASTPHFTCMYFKPAQHDVLLRTITGLTVSGISNTSFTNAQQLLIRVDRLPCKCDSNLPNHMQLNLTSHDAAQISNNDVSIGTVAVSIDNHICQLSAPMFNVSGLLHARAANSIPKEAEAVLEALIRYVYVSETNATVADAANVAFETQFASVTNQFQQLGVAVLDRIFRGAFAPKGTLCGPYTVEQDSVVIVTSVHLADDLKDRKIPPGVDQMALNALLAAESDANSFSVYVFRLSNTKQLNECLYTNSKQLIQIFSNCDIAPSPVAYNSSGNPSQTVQTFPTTSAPTTTNTVSATTVATDVAPTPSPTVTPASPTPTTSPSNSASPSTTPVDTGLLACFPQAAQVQLSDGSMLSMDALQVGHAVRDGSGNFTTVLMFTHSSRRYAKFMYIKTARADIAISSLHYLYVNGRLMTAESVKVGDRVIVCDRDAWTCSESEAVLHVEEKVFKGIFNPQTSSGDIVVFWNGKGIVSSTYTACVRPHFAHALLLPLRLVESWTGRTIAGLSKLFADERWYVSHVSGRVWTWMSRFSEQVTSVI